MTQHQCPSISLNLITERGVITGACSGTVVPGDTVTLTWPSGATFSTLVKEGGVFAFNTAAAPLLNAGDCVCAYATDSRGARSATAMQRAFNSNTPQGSWQPGHQGKSGGASDSIGPRA